MSAQPIGIFDSGVGGLSVAKAIRELMPNESLIYYADTQFTPYGNKPVDLICERVNHITQYLNKHDIKALVVACNTATVNTIQQLREQFSMPIIGVEPGVKPAVLNSTNKKVGVLATENTLQSQQFIRLTQQFQPESEILTQATPDFVTLVEQLEHQSDKAVDISANYVKPLIDAGCDQIVLGCTHFSFLQPAIAQAIHPDIKLVDTATAVAKELKRRLQQNGLLTTSHQPSQVKFISSQPTEKLNLVISGLWQQPTTVLPEHS